MVELAPAAGVSTPVSSVAVIENWGIGYVHRHPLAAVTTVGEQFVLAVHTVRYFFIDLLAGRFQWREFIRQGAFMASTAVLPTVLIALPLGVTLSINSPCWQHKSVRPHWRALQAVLPSSGRRPHLWQRC